MLALALALMLSHAALGDTIPARITVTVTDTTGHAIVTAQVRVDSSDWHAVEATGRAVITGVAPGRHAIEAKAIGYAPVLFHLRMEPGETVASGVTLHQATVLDPVEVRANPERPPAPAPRRLDWTEGFEERRSRNAGGVFLDSAAIRKRGASRLVQLLGAVPGVELRYVPDDYGGFTAVPVMRGVSRVRGEKCPILYYLDGHEYSLSANESIDNIVRPNEIQAMEIYTGSSQVPPQFKSSISARCGVIVIWTKSAR